jgi:perosamine synthetase
MLQPIRLLLVVQRLSGVQGNENGEFDMITFGRPLTDSAELESIQEVMESGIYVHGPKTTEFEKKFCQQLGYNHAVSVSNCTAGLHLAHHSLTKHIDPTVKKQHEVLCPAMTHVATAHAIELAGLTPVFVDCLADDGNMDVELMKHSITDKTVGIAAMHFNGVPCDIKEIMNVAMEHDLYVVEDCAIALGAKVDGKPVGTFGNAGAFSFHPVKQMTTGEGGMIVMNDQAFRDELALERAFGVNRAFNERKTAGLYDVTMLGFNYRMAEIPAAMGIEQLAKLDCFAARRRQNYTRLKAEFDKISGVTVKGDTITNDRSFYCLIAKLENTNSDGRDKMSVALRDAGVQTSIYYPHPLPRLQYYSQKYKYDPSKYPNALEFSDGCLAFPIAPHLNEDDMVSISKTLQELLK